MGNEQEYLEKIDIVRKRTDLGFAEARDLLERTNWDLLEALAEYEFEANSTSNQVFAKIKDVIKQSSQTKIVIRGKEGTVLRIPVALGVIGTAFAPKVAMFGAAACLLSRCSVELHQKVAATPFATDESDDFN